MTEQGNQTEIFNLGQMIKDYNCIDQVSGSSLSPPRYIYISRPPPPFPSSSINQTTTEQKREVPLSPPFLLKRRRGKEEIERAREGSIDLEMGESGIDRLPEGCIAHAISLTSPRDACCSSAVSTAFRSAAASDTVWDRFLPDDLESILSRASLPVCASSKRELFYSLCEPILIDGGKMSFSLDRSTGAKCYMLSARSLFVVWGDTPHYWSWSCVPDSRFSEVAELLDVCWLEIRGKIETKLLSKRTTYAAYLIFKLADRCSGLGYPLQEGSVKLGAHSSTSPICLQPSDMQAHMHARRNRNRVWFRRFVRWREPLAVPEESEEAKEDDEESREFGGQSPRTREDGWMEVELGEFYNDQGEDGEVNMSLLESKGGHWKQGLIIAGIEIRPKRK